MALVVFDRVKETSNTAGTGTIVLAGAVSGYQSFAVVGNANTTYYTIADQQGSNWEVGIGTYYSGNVSLSRDIVLSSSNVNAAVTFGSNTKEVFVTYPAENAVYSNNTPNTSGYVLTANGAGLPPTWQATSGGITAAGNSTIGIFNTNITSNVTIAAGTNGLAVGEITIANNNSVTITSGQKLVVL
jgi:hypothetical protein